MNGIARASEVYVQLKSLCGFGGSSVQCCIVSESRGYAVASLAGGFDITLCSRRRVALRGPGKVSGRWQGTGIAMRAEPWQ